MHTDIVGTVSDEEAMSAPVLKLVVLECPDASIPECALFKGQVLEINAQGLAKGNPKKDGCTIFGL